jgi:hypothetical protein
VVHSTFFVEKVAVFLPYGLWNCGQNWVLPNGKRLLWVRLTLLSKDCTPSGWPLMKALKSVMFLVTPTMLVAMSVADNWA